MSTALSEEAVSIKKLQGDLSIPAILFYILLCIATGLSQPQHTPSKKLLAGVAFSKQTAQPDAPALY